MVCMLRLAGKREGLLWKEVDDRSTEMLPHISYALLVLDSRIALVKELGTCKADIYEDLQVYIGQVN